MTKNDFKRLVPDVMCQDLVVTTDDTATFSEKARSVADMMETGLIAYDYTGTTKGYRLKVFTSYTFKTFLDVLKPGVKVTNARGREFIIESEPYIENLRMCVRANGDTWFCDTIYDKEKNYGKEGGNSGKSYER